MCGLFTGIIKNVSNWKTQNGERIIWISIEVTIRPEAPYLQIIWVKFTPKSLVKVFEVNKDIEHQKFANLFSNKTTITFDGNIKHGKDAKFCHYPENIRILQKN